MAATRFLVDVQHELQGDKSEDLRGKRFVFEGEWVDKASGQIKEVTYSGQIVAFLHRFVQMTRGQLKEVEFFELVCSDPAVRLSRSSKNSAWVLTLWGDKYLGKVRLE